MTWLFQFKNGPYPGTVHGKFVTASSWKRACEKFASTSNVLGETWEPQSELSAVDYVMSRVSGAILVGGMITQEEAWKLDLTGIWLVEPDVNNEGEHKPSRISQDCSAHEETINEFEEI